MADAVGLERRLRTRLTPRVPPPPPAPQHARSSLQHRDMLVVVLVASLAPAASPQQVCSQAMSIELRENLSSQKT